jgi:hypothetical protein
MNEKEKWDYIISLDEELLIGGVILDERISELVRNADISYIHCAYWSTIITSVAGIEGYLRIDNMNPYKNLNVLIQESGFEKTDIDAIQKLRQYRNKLVHGNFDVEEELILDSNDQFTREAEKNARDALKLLRIIVYSDQWI